MVFEKYMEPMTAMSDVFTPEIIDTIFVNLAEIHEFQTGASRPHVCVLQKGCSCCNSGCVCGPAEGLGWL